MSYTSMYESDETHGLKISRRDDLLLPLSLPPHSLTAMVSSFPFTLCSSASPLSSSLAYGTLFSFSSRFDLLARFLRRKAGSRRFAKESTRLTTRHQPSSLFASRTLVSFQRALRGFTLSRPLRPFFATCSSRSLKPRLWFPSNHLLLPPSPSFISASLRQLLPLSLPSLQLLFTTPTPPTPRLGSILLRSQPVTPSLVRIRKMPAAPIVTRGIGGLWEGNPGLYVGGLFLGTVIDNLLFGVLMIEVG